MKAPLMPTRPLSARHDSVFGHIRLRRDKKTGTLTYIQKGANQSTTDRNGVSLDSYIHALYGLLQQADAENILMIGCGGGTLGTMLSRSGRRVTIVDIDGAAFILARRYFGLPRTVRCCESDGLVYMNKTRMRFDAVVIDAFVGEKIPPHMRSTELFTAARRCLRKDGLVLVNVCLSHKKDRTADIMARGFLAAGWPTRLLDGRGPQRNAIVLAGAVKGLRRPGVSMPPATGAAATRRDLKTMTFRTLAIPPES